MKEKTLIMIVDDEPANCELLKQALGQQYETVIFPSGIECLKHASELKPDIILLDVLMPELSGYETCKKLRENDETKDISIIFISALDTLEDRLKGYESGGDDYLSKPVDLEIVHKKITLVLQNKKENQQLKQNIQETQDAFMTALNMGAETGQVATFIEKSFLAQNYEQLFTACFDSMREFDLSCVAQIRFEDEIITLNSEGKLLTLEQELMFKAQYDGRILPFGRRVFFNYSNFSILIKNMPIEDEELYGRLKDHLIVIASAGDARVQSIGTELSLKKHMNISDIFENTLNAVEKIQKILEDDVKKTKEITREMGQGIEEKVLFLGLEEDQEKQLMNIIDSATGQIIETISNKNMINNAFEDVLDGMNNALKYKEL
ncbi:MAG: response regulator [gamma proteobacterium symbiont of Taylorina sp.]|nr:response regulator [gamma proteobacterium symbiont of Taylorina sp.]